MFNIYVGTIKKFYNLFLYTFFSANVTLSTSLPSDVFENFPHCHSQRNIIPNYTHLVKCYSPMFFVKRDVF